MKSRTPSGSPTPLLSRVIDGTEVLDVAGGGRRTKHGPCERARFDLAKAIAPKPYRRDATAWCAGPWAFIVRGSEVHDIYSMAIFPAILRVRLRSKRAWSADLRHMHHRGLSFASAPSLTFHILPDEAVDLAAEITSSVQGVRFDSQLFAPSTQVSDRSFVSIRAASLLETLSPLLNAREPRERFRAWRSLSQPDGSAS